MSLSEYVKECLKGNDPSHDFYHVLRVTKIALQIASTSNVDKKVIEYAAMLHDVDDRKYNSDGNRAKGYLDKCDELSKEQKEKILHIIANCSFSSSLGDNEMDLETSIVSDADKIDAIGALGVARTFMYSGARNTPIHDPDAPIRNYHTLTKEEYTKTPSATVVAHFHEKLLHLHQRIKTTEGKRIAEERTRFMDMFLDQLMKELE